MRWKIPATLLLVVVCSSSIAWGEALEQVRSLVDQGRSVEALSDLDRHLAQSPSDPEALFLRGFVLAEMQREREAEKVFQELSALRPDRPEPLNNLAVILAARGDYDSAVETLKEALRTHPAYRTAYENLTKIYGQLASEAYSRALSVEEAHDRSKLELVLLSDMLRMEPAPMVVAATPRPPLPQLAGSEPRVSAPSASPSVSADQEREAAVTPKEVMEPAPSSPEAAIEAAMQEEREAAMAETSKSDSGDAAELAALVEGWARAWSDQSVDEYLSYYVSGFQPDSELSNSEWQELRRQRLSAPQYVKVSVAFLDFETKETDRALVRFNQSYESDTFSDVVTKTLELVRQGGQWKIVKESVDS